ncbi:MAG: Porin precursor [Verrucomicrobiota bacterium]|jgi:porin
MVLVRSILSLFASMVLLVLPAHADPQTPLAWWQGTGVSGDWFGARETLSDRGFGLVGNWSGIYFGVVASEGGTGGFFTQEINIEPHLDLAKLTRCEALQGWSAFGLLRYRETGFRSNPNNYVEANSLFGPSSFEGGVGWRLMQFGLSYTTPELFGVKDFLTIHGGWLAPKLEFIDQPLSEDFVNAAMVVADGIGGNVPFSAAFSTWGGTIEVKPADWQYTKVGLFMSYPDGSNSNNNGLMFQGYAPDVSQNGLWFMGEAGCTPHIGRDRLPGKYAFGAYLCEDGGGGSNGNLFGLYLQADQMLFREGSQSKNLSAQGLSMFSLVSFAPPYNNQYPLYAQGGLSYEGAIPKRDKDKTMVGFGFAPYQQTEGASHTVFLEAGYLARINGFTWVQPFAQYIVQPAGTSTVANAAILGIYMGVDF